MFSSFIPSFHKDNKSCQLQTDSVFQPVTGFIPETKKGQWTPRRASLERVEAPVLPSCTAPDPAVAEGAGWWRDAGDVCIYLGPIQQIFLDSGKYFL